MKKLIAGLALLVTVAATPASAAPRTRTAPYDFGCLGEPPCSHQVKRAQGGTIERITNRSVCPAAARPYTGEAACIHDLQTTTGVYIPLAGKRTVVATAVVRAPIGGQVTPVGVCFRYTNPPWWQAGYVGCVLARTKPKTMSQTFYDVTPNRDGRWPLIVELLDEGSAVVDRISYEVKP